MKVRECCDILQTRNTTLQAQQHTAIRTSLFLNQLTLNSRFRQEMSSSFTPSAIPALTGRVYLVTGGTAGLGAGTASLLAAHSPAHIYISGRNASNASQVISQLKSSAPNTPVTFLEMDLADLSSVKRAAESLLAQTERLDVLYANAGIMAFPPGTTKDGYEIQFGTNHMGHALLIKLLLPLLQRTASAPDADVRIILNSSVAYKQAPKEGVAFSTVKSPQDGLGGLIPGGRWSRYGQSKLANLLYAQALAKHVPGITSVAVHPGYIKTDLFANVPFISSLPVRIMAAGSWTTVEEGPYTQVWAGTTSVQNLENGAYYVPVAKKGELETATSRDAGLAERLWEWTEKELAAFI
jgi:NAD(P)-dependent dehydrogenase (short-subunit alcohol dehydrogenase family)